MRNPEPEHKPVIGEDGELLEPDISFPLIGYVEPAPQPQPLPTGIRFAIGLLYVIGIIIVGFFVVGFIYVQVSSEVKPSQGNSQVQPTRFADHTIDVRTQIQLPDLELATQWNARLSSIHDLYWSPDGSHLAITYAQNKIASLDIATSQYIFTEFPAVVFDWSTKEANQFVVATRQNIGVYENTPNMPLRTLLRPSTSFQMPPALVRWSTDGTQIAALSQDHKFVDIFDVSDGTLATEKEYPQPTWDIRWSPMMSSLVAVQNDGLYFLQPNNKLIKQKQDDQFLWLDDSVAWKQGSYASDGLRIALTGLDCNVTLMVYARVGNQTWTKPMVDYGTFGCVSDTAVVAWSPRAEQIATFIRGDDAVYLWDSKSGAIFDRLIPMRSRPVTAIAWSPNGQYLAITSNTTITIWSPN